VEPPNPVASTMDLPAETSKGRGAFDTGLHRRQWEFMKGASRGWLGADYSAASCSVQGQRAPQWSDAAHSNTWAAAHAYPVSAVGWAEMLNQGFSSLVLQLLKSRSGDVDGQGVGLGF